MAKDEPTPETEAVAEEAPPGGGFKAKLPLIALIAVGLAVGGGTGAKVIGPMVAKQMGRSVQAPVDSVTADSANVAGSPPADGEKEGGTSSAPAVHLLENLVLNPAGSGGARFLLLSVAIEAASSNTVTDFQARDAELRDIILTALGAKTVDQLTDISARDVIKDEIQTAIANRFGKTAVKRLYFPQFVVQ